MKVRKLEKIIAGLAGGMAGVSIPLYLWSIMPGKKRKEKWEPFFQVLYAHRGLFSNEEGIPENSLLAFTRAVEAGFGMELDVRLTKDKKAIVFHDDSLLRMCGVDRKVSQMTYEELMKLSLLETEEKIPLLTEVLQAVDGKQPLIVEIKSEFGDRETHVVADKILQEYKGRYCIESFNPLVVCWYRKHHKEVIRGQLSDDIKASRIEKKIFFFGLKNLLFNMIARPDFVAYNHLHYHNMSRVLCRKLFGGVSIAWTIKSQEQLEARKKDFDLFIFDGFIPGTLPEHKLS